MNKKSTSLLLLLGSAMLLSACGKGENTTSSKTPTSESPTTSQSVAKTFAVTWNQDPTKYTLVPETGLDAAKIKEGTSFRFHLTMAEAYTKKTNLSVKEGTKELTPNGDGIYQTSALKADATLSISVDINTYVISFVDMDGTKLQEKTYRHGEEVTYEGETPTKAGTQSKTYTFEGWDKEVTKALADATYTATYDVTADPTYFSSFDSVDEIGDIDGEKEFLDTFEGEKGVLKTVEANATDSGAGFLAMHFSSSVMNKAIEAKFDYIRLHVYVDAATESETLPFFSWNAKLGDVAVKQWTNFDISLKTLSENSFLTKDKVNRQGVYDALKEKYVNGQAIMMYTNDAALVEAQAPVTFYLDSITWGVSHGEDSIAGIVGLPADYDLSKGAMTLPTKVTVTDGVFESEKDITEAKIFGLNGETWEEIVAENGTVTLPKANKYKMAVKTDGVEEAYEKTFLAEDLTNTVYSYATDDVYTEDPIGEPYPVKGQHVQIDYHNGGSTWLEEYKDSNGVIEYGVEKANQAQSSVRLDLGNKKFAFDYITIRMCFATETKKRISAYSANVELDRSYYGDARYSNEWFDLKVTRENLKNEGSEMYWSQSATYSDDTDETFYNLCFGTVGYNKQACLMFRMFNYEPWSQATDGILLVSKITYGLNA